MNNESIVTREDKLKIIGLPINYHSNEVTDKAIDAIYNKLLEENESNKKKIKGKICKRESKFGMVNNDSETYIMTLSFLNDIFKVLDKDKIFEITEFKIDRDDLMNTKCNEVLNNHINNIIKHFGKTKIKYNERDTHKCYALTVIKCLTMYCGYDFVSSYKETLIRKQKDDYNVKGDYSRGGKVQYHIVKKVS
jgi:hypothetical protein